MVAPMATASKAISIRDLLLINEAVTIR